MIEQIGKRIADFWKGFLTKDEQRDLLQDLKKQESVLKTKLEQEFLQADETDDRLLSDSEYQSVLKELHKKMGLGEVIKNPRKITYQWITAAAIAMLIGIGGPLVLLQNRFSANDTKDVFAQTAPDTIRLFNQKAQNQKTVLADGSIVILSPGSELLFTADYGKKDRVLQLTGQARFQVAHDTLRPFIVWANNYTTTALGTEFVIDTRESNTVNVMLLSGKIVIKATPFSTMHIHDQYLFPGDKLTIDTGNQSLALTKAETKNTETRINVKGKPHEQENEPLIFEDSPLKLVFEYIALRKKMTIVTDSVDLEGLSFTGEFKDTESLSSIIHIVCRMNDLQYMEEINRIIISKQEKELISPKEKETQITN